MKAESLWLKNPTSTGWWACEMKTKQGPERFIAEIVQWDVKGDEVTFRFDGRDERYPTTQDLETFRMAYERGKWYKVEIPWQLK